MTALMKLYGVPLSQPFRSVAWTLLQQQVRFEIVLTVPGLTNKIGSRHAAYLEKSRGRASTVPLLEDGDGFCIAESPAMLTYLCEKHGWTSLGGGDSLERKAIVNSFMHWHHRDGARQLAKLQVSKIRPDLGYITTDKDMEQAHQVLQALEEGWLRNDDFVAGPDLTIADMMAYEELVQVTMMGLLPQVTEYPRVQAWMDRMTQVPYHDEAHLSLQILGSLAEDNETPLQQRLGKATKAAMKVLKEVQDGFPIASKL